MKNSKEYSGELQKFYRSLKRKYPKVKKIFYEEVIEATVHGIVLEKMSASATKSAFRKFSDHFVDFNDMRVSRQDEIVEMLSEDTDAAREIAAGIVRVLNVIFQKYNSISLDILKKMGKRPARQLLEKLFDSNRFVVDYCMLTSLKGHTIPLTDRMIEFLQNNKLVHTNADYQEIEGFLCRQVSANNGYEFYSLLRRESESRGPAKKKKNTSRVKKKKKKTVTKTAGKK